MLATRGPCVLCCCSCTAESALQLRGRLAGSMWKPAPRVICRLEGLQQQGQQHPLQTCWRHLCNGCEQATMNLRGLLMYGLPIAGIRWTSV
jgi:hypothetical protein